MPACSAASRVSIQAERFELIGAFLDLDLERGGFQVGVGSLKAVLRLRRRTGDHFGAAFRDHRLRTEEGDNILAGRRPFLLPGGQREGAVLPGQADRTDGMDVACPLGVEGDQDPAKRLVLVKHLALDEMKSAVVGTGQTTTGHEQDQPSPVAQDPIEMSLRGSTLARGGAVAYMRTHAVGGEEVEQACCSANLRHGPPAVRKGVRWAWAASAGRNQL